MLLTDACTALVDWQSSLASPLLEARAMLLAPTPVAQAARFSTLLLGVALLVLVVGRAPSARSGRGAALLLGVAACALGLLELARA